MHAYRKADITVVVNGLDAVEGDVAVFMPLAERTVRPQILVGNPGDTEFA